VSFFLPPAALWKIVEVVSNGVSTLDDVNSSLIAEIQVLPLQKLEELRDVLFNFATLADLEVWLNQHKNDFRPNLPIKP
jgi:Domain of unknown function (DUF4351)